MYLKRFVARFPTPAIQNWIRENQSSRLYERQTPPQANDWPLSNLWRNLSIQDAMPAAIVIWHAPECDKRGVKVDQN